MNGLAVYINENDLFTNDDARCLEYFQRALRGVVYCLESGVDVRGYSCWSAFDNFEWVSGYSAQFGIIAVDRSTQKCTPKPCTYWLGEVARANTLG